MTTTALFFKKLFAWCVSWPALLPKGWAMQRAERSEGHRCKRGRHPLAAPAADANCTRPIAPKYLVCIIDFGHYL